MSDSAQHRPHLLIRVGIAEARFGTASAVLRTAGLGSCLGLVMFDATTGIAGMAHVMLPEHSQGWKGDPLQSAKYADLAVPWVFAELIRLGACPSEIRAKLAGGAQMFAFAGKPDLMQIGLRNATAVRIALRAVGVSISGEDCGGSMGRTIEFDTATNILRVRTAKLGTYEI